MFVPLHIYKRLQIVNKDLHKEYQDLAKINLELGEENEQLKEQLEDAKHAGLDRADC